MAFTGGSLAGNQDINAEFAGEAPPRGGGGGGGFGDGSGTGHLVAPPKNITVGTANNFTQFVITFTAGDAVANARNKASWYRLYYLDGTTVSVSDVTGQHAGTDFPPGTPGTQFTGKRTWVQDVPVSTGIETKLVLSAAPYSHGGWFYADGVNAAGEEGYIFTRPAPIPISLIYSSPNNEISGQANVRTHLVINGLNYLQCDLSWLTSTNAVTTPTRYVQIYMENYDDRAELWEGPVFNCSGVGGAYNTGRWTLACDDGTGGFPNPGAHTVTFYFVSLSNSYSHRPDPTAAPSLLFATGIHS